MFICPVTDNKYHAICEHCPLPACKDDKGGREYYAQRNQEIYEYWKSFQGRPLIERPKLMAIAYKYNIKTRQQVWEIIQRCKVIN